MQSQRYRINFSCHPILSSCGSPQSLFLSITIKFPSTKESPKVFLFAFSFQKLVIPNIYITLFHSIQTARLSKDPNPQFLGSDISLIRGKPILSPALQSYYPDRDLFQFHLRLWFRQTRMFQIQLNTKRFTTHRFNRGY